MFDIGGNLAAARKGQRLTPADAERLTRLRGRYLAALEHNDFDALPGHVYARAFLRTYADALGLDADRFVDEFDARYPQREEAPLVRVIPPRGAALPRTRIVVALVAAAGFLVAVVWSVVSPSSKVTPVQLPAPAAAAPERPRAAPAVSHAHAHVVVHPPLVIRAVRGSCWLQVRRGGPGGAVLYEGTLEAGHALRFAPRVWVRLGAPWQVNVRRGAHVVRGLRASTPVNLVA